MARPKRVQPTRSTTTPRVDPPVASTSGPSTRKRPREPIATAPTTRSRTADTSTGDQEPTTESSSESRPVKKARMSSPEEETKEVRNMEEEEGEGKGNVSNTTSHSSDTLQDFATQDLAGEEEREGDDADEAGSLDQLSAEERRRLKGKGRANDDEESQESKGDASELARLHQELAYKDSLVATQAKLLSELRSTVSCSVCLETLDKPYALTCGHVACRGCFVEWFFRADPAASDHDSASNASADSDSGSDSLDSNSESESSASNASSYVGGSFRGQDFRVRNLAPGTSSNVFHSLLTAGASSGALAATDSISAFPPARIEALSDGEDEDRVDEDEKKREMDPEEMRKARLARFGGGAAGPSGSNPPMSSSIGGPGPLLSSAHPFALRPQPPAQPQPQPQPRPAPPAPPPPPPPPPAAAAPTPAARPPRVPKGDHRTKNLVCPQCRTPCSERAPHRIFVLSELVRLVQDAQERGMMKSEETPQPEPRDPSETTTESTRRQDFPGMDESDQSWGGLFPGPNGTESAADRRKRLAQVVRDNDDGVRRCGECNWEIDERTGRCEGCDRLWDVSSDDEDDTDLSDGSLSEQGHPRMGAAAQNRARSLARRHFDLSASESGSDDEDEDEDDSDSVAHHSFLRAGREDTYESDDFVTKSDEEEDEEQQGGADGSGVRSRRKRRDSTNSDSSTSSSSSSSSSSSTSSSSDSDSDPRRSARRDRAFEKNLRRKMRMRRHRRNNRLQGEVIDPDSNEDEEEDEEEKSGSESGSKSNSELETNSDSDSVQSTTRTKSKKTEVPSNSSDNEEEEEVVVKKPKRRIADSDED